MTSTSAPDADLESAMGNLVPALVWRYFDRIRQIPRPSKQEERIAAYVLDWAAEAGFSARRDDAGNLLVRAAATEGFERPPTIVLQAHLDMVCEKNEGVAHDFERQGVHTRIDGEWVRAEGTTLGADNGLGLAMAMAAAVDPELRRGPLELLFTVDEETGLNGARALDGDLVTGRLMINLDAEADDAFYIGCAGAAGVRAWLPISRRDLGGDEDHREAVASWTLAVRGLPGGHSGVDIDRGGGNALSLLARVLAAGLDRGLDPGLVDLRAGDKANAIPREAFASLCPDAADIEAWDSLAAEMHQALREQLGSAAPDLRIGLDAGDGSSSLPPLEAESAARWIRLLDALPHGPTAMSRDMPGLVETSVNLAVARLESNEGEVTLSLRSSSDPALDGLSQSIASLCTVAGARVERLAGYSGWHPDPESALVRRTAEVYRRLFGDPPQILAVHAGLECGVIARRVPGLRAVSLGPLIRGAHSPQERVSVPSVAKVYRWLGALLHDLATTPL